MSTIVGMKFNRLLVISEHERKRTNMTYLCLCDCGNTKITYKQNLVEGITKSCGCFRKEHGKRMLTKHGLSYTKIYNTWLAMNRRCSVKDTIGWKNYGGRGITVCERWKNLQNFIDDMQSTWFPKADIDRIDVDGNYEPTNCRWVTRKENCNNKRIHKEAHIVRGKHVSSRKSKSVCNETRNRR